jgi:hypothetical protein
MSGLACTLLLPAVITALWKLVHRLGGYKNAGEVKITLNNHLTTLMHHVHALIYFYIRVEATAQA